MPVFGTDIFRPFAQGAPISYARRPRHSEDAFILDHELELQSLALIVGVDSPCWAAAILFFTPVLRFFRGFVIKQPIPFDDVQSLRVRRAAPGILSARQGGGKRRDDLSAMVAPPFPFPRPALSPGC